MVNEPYNVDTGRVRFYDDLWDSLDLLKGQGYRMVIISNQSGIAKGYFSEKELIGLELFITNKFDEHCLELDGFYYCPHDLKGSVSPFAKDCSCKKPKPGMINNAASDLQIDLGTSWCIGDILDDIEAGKKAGCRTVLIDNGSETEWIITASRKPDITASSLKDAAKQIIEYDKRRNKR